MPSPCAKLQLAAVLVALFVLVFSIPALALLLALATPVLLCVAVFAAPVLRIVARVASLCWRLFGLLRLGLPVLLRALLLLIGCSLPLGLLLLTLL